MPQQPAAAAVPEDDGATGAQLVALRARLRLFAARALAEWARGLERRRLRWAVARWALRALEQGVAASRAGVGAV